MENGEELFIKKPRVSWDPGFFTFRKGGLGGETDHLKSKNPAGLAGPEDFLV